MISTVQAQTMSSDFALQDPIMLQGRAGSSGLPPLLIIEHHVFQQAVQADLTGLPP